MITDQRKWNCGKTKYIAWKISATVGLPFLVTTTSAAKHFANERGN